MRPFRCWAASRERDGNGGVIRTGVCSGARNAAVKQERRCQNKMEP